MTTTQFFDSVSPTSYSTSITSECLSCTVTEFYRDKIKSRPKYMPVQRRRIFSRVFRIIVNFTTFWAFLKVLPVPHFYCRSTDYDIVAPNFLIGSISNHLSAIQQPYGPEYGKKERPAGTTGQTGSRNMVATRFLDSATPTFWPPIHHSVYLAPLRSFSELTSKVGQSTQLLLVMRIYFQFDHDDDFFSGIFRIIVNFTAFRAHSNYFRFPISTSSPHI